jgi:glutathione S-transferase
MIPVSGEARWRALRLEALADGMAESGIALRWETVRRPQGFRYEPLRDGHRDKLLAGYVAAERALCESGTLDIGTIALAATLDWLEFRSLPSFRETHRQLGRWLDEFRERPSMRATPL